MAERTCVIDGCQGDPTQPGTARGMCRAHYTRWQRYGDPLAPVKRRPRPPAGVCSVDGCDGAGKLVRGLCNLHYKRLMNHPDTFPELPISASLLSPQELFDRKVRKGLAPDDCWLWTGSIDRSGYGKFRTGGRSWLAHRWAYVTYIGELPDDRVVDHVCHNLDRACAGGCSCIHRRCVNPSHLDCVTNLENVKRSHSHNAGKTHCIRGHEFTPENTRRSNGGRYCIACSRMRVR